ncbi:MAG: glycosyl hydrolase, partial [Chitinophagaceae bacterium]
MRIILCLFIYGAIISCSKKAVPSSTVITRNYSGDTNKTKFEVLNYLYSISGSKTIAGIHNREPNAEPERWTDSIYTVTGKYPGLWSGDFLFEQDNIDNRQIMINEALKEWQQGAVVQLMWHACNPALSTPCGYDSSGVLSKLTDAQWKELITDGTSLNKRWKSMIDNICVYLQFLKDHGVEVLWKPLHEMNQGAFWWGGRPGPNGTLKLYQEMHDYMTKTKGLTNLIWVWDIQDLPGYQTALQDYNPGNNYWDVLAFDVYDNSGYTLDKYYAVVNAANGKPIAIGECATLPTQAILEAQPKWIFFMSWSELTFSSNTISQINALYHASDVITLDKMPGW